MILFKFSIYIYISIFKYMSYIFILLLIFSDLLISVALFFCFELPDEGFGESLSICRHLWIDLESKHR